MNVCLIPAFGEMRVEYNVHFNNVPMKVEEESDSDDENEGPVVERKCSKCGNEKMSYATLQLRSADEGQTVFYTCTKCHFKETENS
jgi:DNA-directed RNA polymerase I subunit RPA12